jgi:peptidoglycan/LPS O-acetylase OafA/YrhL
VTRARLRSIDCLRGVAALTVCVGHAIVAFRWNQVPGEWFQAFCEFVTKHGGLGVPLFFVISGFCIHLKAARQRAVSGEVDFRFVPFWKRRLWRLYPTYFVVLCGSMLLLVVHSIINPAAPALAAYPQPKSTWMAYDFLAHVFMLHGFFPLFDQGAGNPPFWTLAREEYLYCLYPIVLVFQSRLGIGWGGLAIALLATRAGALITSFGIPLGPFEVIVVSVLPAWIQWYLGALAAEVYYGNITAPGPFRSIWAVPLWILLAERIPGDFLVFYGVAFFTLINAVVGREQAGRWHDRGILRLLAWVGFMSYSLYLVHDPVQGILASALGRAAVVNTPSMYLLRGALMVGGSVAAARVLFVLCESRFLEPRQSSAPSTAPALADAM